MYAGAGLTAACAAGGMTAAGRAPSFRVTERQRDTTD
jgi:hypothetical protein